MEYIPSEADMRERLKAAAYAESQGSAEYAIGFEISRIMMMSGEPLLAAFRVLQLHEQTQGSEAMPLAA